MKLTTEQIVIGILLISLIFIFTVIKCDFENKRIDNIIDDKINKRINNKR